MAGARVLWVVCRWAPWMLLLAVVAVLLGAPLPKGLVAALAVACLALLLGLAWLDRRGR